MHQRQRDRGLALAMEGDDLRQVDVREGIAGDDEERAVEIVGQLPDRPARAERGFLHAVTKPHPDPAAVPVAVLDDGGEVLKRDERVLDAVALEELEDVPEARLVDDGHHRLRTIDRQRSKTAPLAARHHDGLHWRESSSAFLRSDREERLEVVARVGLECDVGLGLRDAGDLGDPPRHDVGEFIVLARADHRDEVEITCHRIHLGNAVHCRECLAELRERAAFGRDEDDRRDHVLKRSQALDVDVVQRRLHVVRGLLETHRLAAIERGLVRVERVLARLVVVHVELLFALVDRELDAVTRGRADQGESSERKRLRA